jgi:2-methylcitrate dehydratase PrpD
MTVTGSGNLGDDTTARLAEWVARVDFADLPATAVRATRRLICDAIGCAIGARALDAATMVADAASELGGPSRATVLGFGTKVGAAAAAFANGYLGSALDADETLQNRSHHGSPSVFPALALAESGDASGHSLITAVAISYDVAVRIGHAMAFPLAAEGTAAPSIGSSPGWVSMGAAAGAAKVLRLDAVKTANALGIAGWTSPAPFALRWPTLLAPKAMLKFVPHGFMSHQAVLSALLAAKGFTGDRHVLDGDTGYWKVAGSVACDWDFVFDRLGEQWWIEETSFKPYAVGRDAHCAVDLFRRLVDDHALRPDDISEVAVWTVPSVASEWFTAPPQTQTDVPFSIPFVLAAYVHGIDLGPPLHSWRTIRDERLADFATRVHIASNSGLKRTASMTTPRPTLGSVADRGPTRVEVHANGQVFAATADFARGDPWTPELAMSDDDLARKFRSFCSGIVPDQQVEDALSLLMRLDEVDNIARDIMPLLLPRDGGTLRTS